MSRFAPFSCFCAAASLCALLAACGTASRPADHGGGSGGTYKVGQPYQINGNWYYPREDYSYDETGVASWYGGDFHNQRTANGEVYNKDELTAAHKTLPLPTLARVTNLENGKSIVVRINDRGPFSGTRLIDVSQRAAQLLGFENSGTAKVRVQVLADESKAIADAMRHYGSTEVASAAPAAPDMGTAPSVQPAQLQPVTTAALAAPVQTETLRPVQTTPEVHKQLLATKPVAEAVQLPVTGRTNLFVQAGAFANADNAAKMQQSLSRLGPTSVSTIMVNGTKFYRVRVGPVADVPHADALLAKVRQAGASAARTVVD